MGSLVSALTSKCVDLCHHLQYSCVFVVCKIIQETNVVEKSIPAMAVVMLSCLACYPEMVCEEKPDQPVWFVVGIIGAKGNRKRN